MYAQSPKYIKYESADSHCGHFYIGAGQSAVGFSGSDALIFSRFGN
jgi:hypothetical protein